jgi:hypothetical protein
MLYLASCFVRQQYNEAKMRDVYDELFIIYTIKTKLMMMMHTTKRAPLVCVCVCVPSFVPITRSLVSIYLAFHHSIDDSINDFLSLSLSLSIYIYIYPTLSMGGCACVGANAFSTHQRTFEAASWTRCIFHSCVFLTCEWNLLLQPGSNTPIYPHTLSRCAASFDIVDVEFNAIVLRSTKALLQIAILLSRHTSTFTSSSSSSFSSIQDEHVRTLPCHGANMPDKDAVIKELQETIEYLQDRLEAPAPQGLWNTSSAVRAFYKCYEHR